MIRLFRRHKTACTLTSETDRRCKCPIYAEGKVGSERLQKTALNLTSWEAAQRWVRDRETAGTLNLKTEVLLTHALKQFIADCESRNLNHSTLTKCRYLQTKLNEFATSRGLTNVVDLDTLPPWKPLSKSSSVTGGATIFKTCLSSPTG